MGLEDSRQVTWAAMKKDENYESMNSTSINDSETSSSSSSSSSAELADDAASSSNSSPFSGTLYDFADELMAQLPIKRGLSKYYHGKSQTFASLANVSSLTKNEASYRYRKRLMKSCKTYGSNLNRHKFGPKGTIAKRSPKISLSPLQPQLCLVGRCNRNGDID